MNPETQVLYQALPPEQNPYYKIMEKKNLSRIGIAMVLQLLLTHVLAAAIVLAVSWIAPEFSQSEVFLWIINLVPSYCIALPIVCLALHGMNKKVPEKKAFSLENKAASLSIAFFLMMAGNLVSIVLMSLIETMKGAEITNQVSEFATSAPKALIFLSAVVLAPLAEEWVFRKLLMDRLLPYSEKLAVVASGLFFGLAHGNFYQFFYATLLGTLFAILYAKTGKLRYPIFLHMLINFTGSIVVPLFAEVTSEQAEFLSSINPWAPIYSLYLIATYILAVCGLIFFIRKRKSLSLSEIGDRQLTVKTQQKLFWGSTGTIVFLILAALNFVSNLFI